MPQYLRLRQICLVAHDLEPVVDQLCQTFGVAVCHRDPNVNKHGLHNALMPFGNTFMEVVAPLPGKAPGETAGGRYMQRIGGDCGYMVIMDHEDVKPFREHVAAIGVRIANKLDYPTYQGTQLHPKDVGGTIMSIGHDDHGDDIRGDWHAAGKDWKQFVHTERVESIVGVETQSDDPQRLVPIVWEADDYMVVVTGDPARNSAYIFLHNGLDGYPTAREIHLPRKWQALRGA